MSDMTIRTSAGRLAVGQLVKVEGDKSVYAYEDLGVAHAHFSGTLGWNQLSGYGESSLRAWGIPPGKYTVSERARICDVHDYITSDREDVVSLTPVHAE